ncbi:MAG: ABC transporter permease [Desulfovibrionaceae bacterium]
MFLSARIALASLKAHKLRTLLAMLGVFLGALALTGVQHLSEAMLRKAEMETERLGPNLFMARAGMLRMSRNGAARVRGHPRTFSLGDARALVEGLPQAVAGAPFVDTTMPVRHGGTTVTARLVATTPVYTGVRSFHPQFGRFFSDAEVTGRAKVCVLGRTIAERLFGDPAAAVGRTVRFFRAQCLVIGVMEAKGADIAGTDQDEQVFVPITTYQRRFANQTWISGVYIQLADLNAAETAKATATDILRQRHGIRAGKKDDFGIITARDAMRVQKQALDLVGTLGLIASSLSFAVGGLGILSIMILLVRARRLEIGVRRATGARRPDIVRQFLLESGAMSMAGGLAGVGAALGLLVPVCALGGFPYVFDPALVGGALAGSALLGLAAGAYPAWQASRLEVLDVLRGE